MPDVVGKLKAIAQNNPDRRIFVRGDKDLPDGPHHGVDGDHHAGRLHACRVARGANRTRRAGFVSRVVPGWPEATGAA